jgi:apolipoprotein N-acyltransferase
VLITMSLALGAYAHRLSFEAARGRTRRCPEFWMAMLLILGGFTLYLQEAAGRGLYAKFLARVALVQPDIPQAVKWDNSKTGEILATLNRLTTEAAATKPDLILWPEASTPFALNADPDLRDWVEKLASDARCPLVLGSIATLPPGPEGHTDWFNAAFVTDPATGVRPEFYAKRKLVPFGEFVPLRPLLGWIGKFVPIGDDFGRGTAATPLAVRLPGSIHALGSPMLALGPLICYEDNFPALARADALAGADALLVLTNNGWFGEGGAAYQQAASAVLRAVETRRPVLRDGNAGWSGWIDEFGGIRAVLTQDDAGQVSTDPAAKGTIYFCGTATVNVTRDSRWVGQQTIYTLHGDWFVAVSGVLALAAWLALRRLPPVA